MIPPLSKNLKSKGESYKYIEKIAKYLVKNDMDGSEEHQTLRFICFGELAETELGKVLL